MLKSFIVFTRFFLFWLLFFFLDRLIFLIYFWDEIRHFDPGLIMSTFWYALRLDASMAGYISAIPLIFYIVFLYLKKPLPRAAGRVYVIVLLGAFSLISGFNLNLYREWGAKINYRALDLAFNSTREAIASSSSSPIFLSALVVAVIFVSGILLSDKIIDYRMTDRSARIPRKIAGSLLALAITFLAIRGGWQLSPVNQSMSYFTTETILNHAAVNTEWNLMQNVINNKYGSDNPYKYYTKEDADKIVAGLFAEPSSETIPVLTTDRPNIVLIILESYTAQLVGVLGGEKTVSPNIDALSKEGLLFTDIYAAAGRTDKGVVATISGFPAQAIRSVMKQNGKQEKLPGIATSLRKEGYQTSFYYGGESEFFNMKSYILSHGYQTLVDQHSFRKRDMNSKWGTYDDKVFAKNLSDLDRAGQPFFSTILTLTNHEPFELPVEPHFKGENVENKFRSTAFYTDSCLGAYIEEAKKKDWYKNTLFVIVADHGHRLPGNISEYDPNRYRIPLLFLGDVIREEFRGKKIEKTGSQTDVVATILNQLNLPAGEYTWSKDLLNPGTREFAFFNWDNGFGFATKEQAICFDNVGKNVILRSKPANEATDSLLIRNGKAYMQKVFEEYMDL